MTRPNVPSATIKDENFFFHPFTALKAHESNGGKIFVSGEKSTLTDESGKKFLDAMAGLWCVNLGYGNAELADTISHQAFLSHDFGLVFLYFGRNSNDSSLEDGVSNNTQNALVDIATHNFVGNLDALKDVSKSVSQKRLHPLACDSRKPRQQLADISYLLRSK